MAANRKRDTFNEHVQELHERKEMVDEHKRLLKLQKKIEKRPQVSKGAKVVK